MISHNVCLTVCLNNSGPFYSLRQDTQTEVVYKSKSLLVEMYEWLYVCMYVYGFVHLAGFHIYEWDKATSWHPLSAAKIKSSSRHNSTVWTIQSLEEQTAF